MLALGVNIVEAHAPFYMKKSSQTLNAARLSCDDDGCDCDDSSSDEE